MHKAAKKPLQLSKSLSFLRICSIIARRMFQRSIPYGLQPRRASNRCICQNSLEAASPIAQLS